MSDIGYRPSRSDAPVKIPRGGTGERSLRVPSAQAETELPGLDEAFIPNA
jgi:hypothetical protein